MTVVLSVLACRKSLVVIGLTTLGVTACSEPTSPVELEFAAMLDGRAVGCTDYTDRAKLGVSDLRLYVSDVALIDPQRGAVPLELDQNRPEQYDNVTLLRFAWPGRKCGPNEPAGSEIVIGKLPEGGYTGVAFTVGVPFELNHEDALTAPPPLNSGSMFWTWQLGYKFLRLDTDSLVPGREPWSFHLGSSGCRSPSSLRPPSKPCDRPNRVRVELQGFDPSTDRIVLDVDPLIDVLSGEPAEVCVGNFHRLDICRKVFERLALDPDTGQCIEGCRNQVVFRIDRGALQ